MATKPKLTVNYFPHECTHGRKMFILEERFGNDGYATWFKLLEQLGRAENHYLDIRDYTQKSYLFSYCKVDEKTFDEITKMLSELGAIHRQLFTDFKVIWSPKFSESIEDAYKKRNADILDFAGICNHLSLPTGANDGSIPTLSGANDDIHPQIKLKESKEEETKEKESTKGARVKHSFDESDFYEYELFKNQFITTKYSGGDMNYYYEAVKDWSANKGELSLDWIAVARSFMRRDMAKDEFQEMGNGNLTPEEQAIEFEKRYYEKKNTKL